MLVRTARAQTPKACQLCDLSVRWARYYAAAYRVPVELVEAIIDAESGWNPYAVSRTGAAGIMQLMPGTAEHFGVHNRFRVDENIHGGVAAAAIQRRPSLSHRGVLRGRVSDFTARTQLLLSRCPRLRSTRVPTLPCKTNSAQRLSNAEAQVEVTNEKCSGSWLFVAIGPDGGNQCAANGSRSAGSLQTNCGSQDHDD